MEIEINNRQRRYRVNTRGICALVRFFLDQAQRQDRTAEWGNISVVIVDDAEIQVLNRQCLNRAETTDVLSFRYKPMPGDNGLCGGEVIVNAERAAGEGKRRGGTHKELALYIAHGCDHLMENDDGTPANRRRMRHRELRWLKRAADHKLLNHLFLGGKA